MCGFVCLFNDNGKKPSVPGAALLRMQRRGPDSEGHWIDDYAFLGHRRLSIIDLDTRASQPMSSACGRYVIVFNGEIYNFVELRNELISLGVVFFTKCDTEVILNLFIRHGESMLGRLRGMFAFVVWDKVKRKAFAARDPYGIKPLYFSKIQHGVAIASQVKALLATGLVQDDLNPIGWAGFWMLGSVPEPHTVYRDIVALRAGHCMWIEKGRIGLQRHWNDIGDIWRNASLIKKVSISKDELKSLVRKAVFESVHCHLVSDVPVGIFLSGGIDSSVISALTCELGARSQIGITIAFEEYKNRKNDEAAPAARVARYYGLDHVVRTVDRAEFFADLPRIFDAMDQPSIDGINTWYASKAAKEQGLKVVLSGIGGDELFFGYDSFRSLPPLMRASRALFSVPHLPKLANLAASVKARISRNRRWAHSVNWLAQGVEGAWWLRRSAMSPDEAKAAMGSQFAGALCGFSPEGWIHDMTGPLAEDISLALAQIESTVYLRNQLLRDSDWASMDHGVEVRAPLVDAYLLKQVETILPLFPRYHGKALLTNIAVKSLPPDIINKRKTGFNIPVLKWLGEMRKCEGIRLDRHYWMSAVSEQFYVG